MIEVSQYMKKKNDFKACPRAPNVGNPRLEAGGDNCDEYAE